MVQMGFPFRIVLLLFCFCFQAIHSSRTFSQSSKTTSLLSVAASTQKTVNVFSLDSRSTKTHGYLNQQEQSVSSSSSISLHLHSRVFLHRPSHNDYRSLSLARLKRDSARVRSLTTRLDLVLGGVSNSDLKPAETQNNELEKFKAEDVQAPVVSGRVKEAVSTSPELESVNQRVQSTWCSTLGSLDVSECRNDTCLYEVSYGDGSYTVGDFVTETVTLGTVAVDNVAIGCGHNNEGLFIGAAGLLGLGGGSLSFPSQLNATSFSYCLVDRDSDSASTLEFDSPFPPNAVTAPLLRNPQLDTFYYLGMEGLSVGGELLSIPKSFFEIDGDGNGGVIIDSGTAVTRLQTDMYNALRDAFVNGTRHLQSTEGVALFDTCYDLSSKTSVEVPTVSFHFPNGSVLPLPAENFLIPLDSNGTFALRLLRRRHRYP
ncbi:hypothetical protein F8388_019152 [Cannabis sativa]|uniref:Peptidase A1 domain-containing protein n=1 Tax=Cannabis sativa TaxID=3483 RepID=A0A7J6EBD1_CANSA|nr:hypothetical protein F8388_019152 [Cannabis sativa]